MNANSPEISLRLALRLLQRQTANKFGRASTESGEATIYISGKRVDVTDANGTVVAAGPAKVARFLTRKTTKE